MDNSASMFNDDTKTKKTTRILGAWAKSTAKTYPEDGNTHNIILARFSGRLQIEAKIEITNGNVDYYSFNGPQENWDLTNKTSSVTIENLDTTIFEQFSSHQPTIKDQYWGWNGNEYNKDVRMTHGTGFGATFFYHALGDLKNFIELKMKAGSKYTLVSLGDAEKFDDSNEAWTTEDFKKWKEFEDDAKDELNRRKRNEYEHLRLSERQICQDILKGLSDTGLDQIYFVHASDGDKNLHNGLNKSQFMMSRLFRDHCNNGDFDLKFPSAKLSLDAIKSGAECEVRYTDIECCASPTLINSVTGNKEFMWPVGSDPMYGKYCRGSRDYKTESGTKIFFDIKAQQWILNENGRKYPTMTTIQSKCCPKGVSFSNGLSLSCDLNRADQGSAFGRPDRTRFSGALEINRKCLE